jgi:hypothetical protein
MRSLRFSLSRSHMTLRLASPKVSFDVQPLLFRGGLIRRGFGAGGESGSKGLATKPGSDAWHSLDVVDAGWWNGLDEGRLVEHDSLVPPCGWKLKLELLGAVICRVLHRFGAGGGSGSIGSTTRHGSSTLDSLVVIPDDPPREGMPWGLSSNIEEQECSMISRRCLAIFEMVLQPFSSRRALRNCRFRP